MLKTVHLQPFPPFKVKIIKFVIVLIDTYKEDFLQVFLRNLKLF